MHSSPSSSLYSQLRSTWPTLVRYFASCEEFHAPSPQVSVRPYIWATKKPFSIISLRILGSNMAAPQVSMHRPFRRSRRPLITSL